MTKKATKKDGVKTRKVSAKAVPKKSTRVKKPLVRPAREPKKSLKRSSIQSTLVTEPEVVRSLARPASPHQVKGYYAMGAWVLGLVGCFLAGYAYLMWHEKAEDLSLDSKTAMTVPVGDSTPSSGELAEEFQGLQDVDFAGRINFWSAYLEKDLKGRKKLLNLVEDHSIQDSVPIVPKKYNCTTYVETVVALAKSRSSDDFIKHLLAIRYLDSKPGFMSRNHFPEADWIPNNQNAKILTDITERVASTQGLEFKAETKTIDRGKWLRAQVQYQAQDRSLASVSDESWSRPVKVQVPYIEISKVKNILAQIPSGTVLNLVHKDDSSHPVLITHQGLVIQEGGKTLLRHASIGGRIRTNELSSYLLSLVRRQSAKTKWPLIGINLNQMSDSTSVSSLRSDAK